MAKNTATPGQTAAQTQQAAKSFTVEMTKDKETKNSRRFQEDEVEGQPNRIGQLYVQKHAVGSAVEHIRVTVEAQ